MESNEDCKYYKDGMCHLTEMEDCQKINNPYYDNVHQCEMVIPCFNDALKPKKEHKLNWAVYCATNKNRNQCSVENCTIYKQCLIKQLNNN